MFIDVFGAGNDETDYKRDGEGHHEGPEDHVAAPADKGADGQADGARADEDARGGCFSGGHMQGQRPGPDMKQSVAHCSKHHGDVGFCSNQSNADEAEGNPGDSGCFWKAELVDDKAKGCLPGKGKDVIQQHDQKPVVGREAVKNPRAEDGCDSGGVDDQVNDAEDDGEIPNVAQACGADVIGSHLRSLRKSRPGMLHGFSCIAGSDYSGTGKNVKVFSSR